MINNFYVFFLISFFCKNLKIFSFKFINSLNFGHYWFNFHHIILDYFIILINIEVYYYLILSFCFLMNVVYSQIWTSLKETFLQLEYQHCNLNLKWNYILIKLLYLLFLWSLEMSFEQHWRHQFNPCLFPTKKIVSEEKMRNRLF